MKSYSILLIGLCLSCIGLQAQMNYAAVNRSGSNNQLRVQVANLNQDLELLRDQIGQLKQTVAQLRQENVNLLSRLDAQEKRQISLAQDVVSHPQLEASIDQLKQKFRTEQGEQKELINQNISRQINKVSDRFNLSLKTLADTIKAQPKTSPEVNFTEDYPRTGIPYIVEAGDTLSGIAKRFNSTVRDIQNANHIARPSRDLRIGQTIFIPQAE